MVDDLSRIPLFQKRVSGHVSDKTSFKETVLKDLPMIKEQFSELRCIVGDSAFRTSDIAKAAADQGIWFVARIPGRNGEAAPCIAWAAAHPEWLAPVDPEDPSSPKAMWPGEGMIGDQKIIKLAVRNEMLESGKREAVGKRARKGLEELRKMIAKLCARPGKCRADAEKRVAALQEKLKSCAISNVQYEAVRGCPRRGRNKEGDPGILKAVRATADADIFKELVEEAVKRGTCYVICTNDTGREWTMRDLLATCKRLSVVERSWRCLKDRRVLVSAIWLQLPSRICALMWLLFLALLVHAAAEYLMRKAMRENGLTILWTDHRTEMAQPSLLRVYTRMINSGIRVHIDSDSGDIWITGMPLEIYKVLDAMGPGWNLYYQWRTYEPLRDDLCGSIGF